MGFALYLLVVTIVVCEEISNTDIGLKTHYKGDFSIGYYPRPYRQKYPQCHAHYEEP